MLTFRVCPPALFVVGTEDMLLEDSERMDARWQEASGNSELLLAPESPHAFNHMGTAVASKIENYVDAWMLEQLGEESAYADACQTV